jgi:hypothetical protein
MKRVQAFALDIQKGLGFIIFGREPGCAGGRGTQSRATSHESNATSGDIFRIVANTRCDR